MTDHDASRRLPTNYQIVYDVVCTQAPGVHAPVGDIFVKAKAVKPGMGYSTVYRALDRLRELGLILQLHVPGTTAAVYEPARASHAHFVCTACGALEDIDCDLAGSQIAAAVGARRAVIDDITVTVHGRCEACLSATG